MSRSRLVRGIPYPSSLLGRIRQVGDCRASNSQVCRPFELSITFDYGAFGGRTVVTRCSSRSGRVPMCLITKILLPSVYRGQLASIASVKDFVHVSSPRNARNPRLIRGLPRFRVAFGERYDQTRKTSLERSIFYIQPRPRWCLARCPRIENDFNASNFRTTVSRTRSLDYQ